MGACVLEKEQYLYSHGEQPVVLEKEQYLYSHGSLSAREGTVTIQVLFLL